MKEEWQEKTIGEVCSRLSSGKNIKASQINDKGLYPVFGGNGLRGYSSECNFHGDCSIIGRQGAFCGNVHYFNGDGYITEHGVVAVANEENNTHFLYYLLSTLNLGRLSCQAAQPGLAVGTIAKQKILLPPLPTQQKIASILSAYDDLIENNRKQIKLLEEAAQKLYKEWFVKLNFPGHENTKIVDGIPEGWKKVKLIDLVDVQYGYAFEGSLFNDKSEGTPIIRIRNIPDGTTNDFTTEKAPVDYIVHNGDIVVGMDGEFHINTWNQGDAYLVQRSCSFRPHNELMKGYLLQAIYTPIKFFENTVVGATVAHLGKKHIDTIEVFECPENLYIPFDTFLKKRQILLNQNQSLQSARDKLLPKLMNGEFDL